MSLTLSNAFAALEVRKTKKKKTKESDKKKKGGRDTTSKEDALQLEREIFSKRQFNVSNWADCDDDDDDLDGGINSAAQRDSPSDGKVLPQDDGHDSEEVIDLEKEFGIELEPEPDPDAGLDAEKLPDNAHRQETGGKPDTDKLAEQGCPSNNEGAESSGALPERTMSKKEIKRRGMEELDAVLAELGIACEDNGKKCMNGETKSMEKKKNRRKNSIAKSGSWEAPENVNEREHENIPETGAEDSEECTMDETVEEQDVVKPPKPRLLNRKKSQKKLSGCTAAAAAVAEAKARSKKKGKKDTSHYNQAPPR